MPAQTKVRSYVRRSSDFSTAPEANPVAIVMIIAAAGLLAAVHWQFTITLALACITGYGVIYQIRQMTQR